MRGIYKYYYNILLCMHVNDFLKVRLELYANEIAKGSWNEYVRGWNHGIFEAYKELLGGIESGAITLEK